jgi:hypothetical protein
MILPPMPPLDISVAKKYSVKAYKDYCRLLVAANPGYFLPLGTKRRWWHFFKIEHPLTSWRDDENLA